MDNVGAEVGQKMRSAVKAKLMELGCYVDDELPDYIMVMVANKRTKLQMNHDLELFLNNKTSTFVNWLHIVLKKLEEITVTNPAILKKISKRKSDEDIKPIKIKKEKKDKTKTGKKNKQNDFEPPTTNIKIESNLSDRSSLTSLTDDLPIKANKLSEVRKVVIMKENNDINYISKEDSAVKDNFDIPSLSEVSSEHQLAEIEMKIKSAKSRAGMQVVSGSEDDDYINIKVDPEDLFYGDSCLKEKKLKEDILRKIRILDSKEQHNSISRTSSIAEKLLNEGSDHPRIVFRNDKVSTPPKRKSVLERLGRKSDSPILESDTKRMRLSPNTISIRQHLAKNKQTESAKANKAKEVPRESALKRLGLMSKVAVPQKEVALSNSDDNADDLNNKDVQSVVKVKPRILLPTSKQANKNLLLKAVAEAQRSVAQTRVIRNSENHITNTKKDNENLTTTNTPTKKLSIKDKNNLRNILVSAAKQDKRVLDNSSADDDQYISKKPQLTSKSTNHSKYISSSRGRFSDDCENLNETDSCKNLVPKQTKNQTFIITLDGISRKQEVKSTEIQKNVGKVNKKRKAPSPIVFESSEVAPMVTAKVKLIPDNLPTITQTVIKPKERCKYWPTCRQGESCEFVHPTVSCRAFPQCSFGDKCIYLHPTCKFETSCTRKDCSFSHVSKSLFSNPKTPQQCKFYPNCNNIHCSFFHPRPCKYGKNCKNSIQCGFSHTFPSKISLTWRSPSQ